MAKKTAKKASPGKTAEKKAAVAIASEAVLTAPTQSAVSLKSHPTQGAKVEEGKVKAEETPESEWKENLIAILVVTLVILALWAYFGGWFAVDEVKLEEIPRYAVPIGDDPMLGNQSAHVTLIEFSDYFCTACKAFHEQTWPQLKANYIDTGKVRFVYRDFPLETIHKETYKASSTVTCAGEQDAYWAFHDAFYERQDEIGEELIAELVTQYGLDQESLDACRAEEVSYKEAQFDFEEGKRLGGVSGTPTFFINGRKLVGNQAYEDFAAIIEEELN